MQAGFRAAGELAPPTPQLSSADAPQNDQQVHGIMYCEQRRGSSIVSRPSSTSRRLCEQPDPSHWQARDLRDGGFISDLRRVNTETTSTPRSSESTPTAAATSAAIRT
jgi:hypothetical protein